MLRHLLFCVPVAQLEERQFPKLKVAGSIPVGCAKRPNTTQAEARPSACFLLTIKHKPRLPQHFLHQPHTPRKAAQSTV